LIIQLHFVISGHENNETKFELSEQLNGIFHL